MSSGLTVVVAISTAVAVVVVTLLLSKLVRAVVAGAPGPASGGSRARRLARRRPRQSRLTVRPATEPVAVRPVAEDSPTAVAEEPVLALAPHPSPERSVDVKDLDEADRNAEPEPASYRQVGEEVAAVLTAADQAAVQIRETALRDAEQTRRAAEEQAAAIGDEAQARRAETDRYREETLAAADSYAEETRRRADEEAAETVSRAEEQARLVRQRAEQNASEIEAEAARRREALAASLEGMEERIESMVGVFRRETRELEDLLPPERRSGAEQQERLDEALRPSELTAPVEH